MIYFFLPVYLIFNFVDQNCLFKKDPSQYNEAANDSKQEMKTAR